MVDQWVVVARASGVERQKKDTKMSISFYLLIQNCWKEDQWMRLVEGFQSLYGGVG
jgi:hypothetical protein